MIRRSRISVRPNVRPGNRSTASQETSQKIGVLSSQATELTETAPEQPEASTTCTKKPETEASCQDEVSQSRKQVLGPPWRKNIVNISLSKQHQSTAITDMTYDESTSLSPPNRCTPSSQKNSTRDGINKDETSHSTASLQVKADCKTPQRSKGLQCSTAVPRQCKLKCKEDIHALQQPDIMCLNKENTNNPESNTKQGTTLKVTSLQLDPLSMDSSKASENSQGTSSLEQDTTPTLEKFKYKQTNKDSTAMRPQGLNDPADRIRLGKAQKLRELLKQEICKERSQKNITEKMKRMQYETLKDHSKMTMRELIYYLPKTNPMKSYQEKDQHTNETTISSPVPPQGSEEIPTQHEQCVGGREQAQEEDVANLSESESSEPLLVPQVKVAEDGSLIIDEESLTVEVLRNKGPNLSEDRDPIFERGSTTTYSSFRKGSYTKPWSSQETDMFFLAISMVGTDFSMIGSMFPHRARSEIKNKFKKEERANAWRIDKAFREKRRLDLEFFTELLDKILADEERKKMNKEKPARVQQRRIKKKPRVRKPVKAASDTEDSTEEDPVGDSTEGEKENEDYINEHGTSDGKKGRKGRERRDFSPMTDRQTLGTEYNDIGIECPGRSTPGESPHSDGRDSEIGYTPLMCELQQRTSSKVPGRTSGKAGQNAIVEDCATKETKGTSSRTPKRLEVTSRARKSKKESVEVNEELPDKSNRSLKRPQVPKEKSKEQAHSNDDPPNIVSRSNKKQTGLVTIRATVSEEDMEVQDKQELGILQDCYPTNPEDQNQFPAFVPLDLCSPSLENAVVEEAVQEDVIDFIAPENLEESEESYKEAAQTLLTIGNSAHMRQISAPVSADQEQTDEQVTCGNTAPGRPDVSSEPTVHGASFAEINAVEESTDVSQLADANCEEPIFIISLTEISPSFIDTLPSDTDPPLSHTELLLCNPEPLPSLSESLTSETKSLPCITDTLPLNTESMPSFSDMGSLTHLSQSLTESHNTVTDFVPCLKEPTPSITDNLPSVTEHLSSVGESSAMTAQLNTQEVLGRDISVTNRRAAPGHSAGQLFADDLVSKEGEEKGDKNNQLEFTTDISPTNIIPEASAIPPGKTHVQSNPPSRQVSAKCIQAKTTPVSQISKTNQSSLTGNLLETSYMSLPKSRVKETQSSTLEEIGSFYDFAPKVSNAINRRNCNVPKQPPGGTWELCLYNTTQVIGKTGDELQTATGMVSHLLIPNALVAVSDKQEEGDEKGKLTLPSSTSGQFIDKADKSSAPNATMSPSVYCSTASHRNNFMDNSEQELTSEDPSIHPNISHWKSPQNDIRAVSHMIVPDALVPVSVKMEKKQMSKQRKFTKREKPDNLDTGTSTNESVTRSSGQLDSDRLIEEMSPPKKRKLLEGTRRAKLQVKPALPVRRISSQNASGEKPALLLSSTESFSTSHSWSAQTNSTQLPKSSSKPPSAVSVMVGEESSVDQPSTSPVTIHAATRPGRKPKGFLSFMSSKNVSGTTTTRPPQVKSTQSRTMPIALRTISQETELATSCSSSSRTTCDTGNAVLITSSCNAHSWNPEVNPSESRQPCIKHHSEEPTKISEYFLSNIFTEVDEQD